MTRTEWEPLRLKRIEEYKKMTVKERRKAFLDDTIAHYNSENRGAIFDDTIAHYNSENRGAIFDIGGCVYRPTQTSCGCAIGRWLPVEVSNSLPQAPVHEDGIPDSLPVWMVEMGLDFLLEVQDLHDIRRYWDAAGLTEFGTREAASIRRRFKLN